MGNVSDLRLVQLLSACASHHDVGVPLTYAPTVTIYGRKAEVISAWLDWLRPFTERNSQHYLQVASLLPSTFLPIQGMCVLLSAPMEQ